MTLSHEIEHFNPYSPRVRNLTTDAPCQLGGHLKPSDGETFRRTTQPGSLDGEKAVISRSTSRIQNFLHRLSSTLRGWKP